MRLGLRAVLGNVGEEAGACAVLNVHRSPGREQPQGDVRRQPLVLWQQRTVLVAIGFTVEAVAERVGILFLLRPEVVRVHILALASWPLAVALGRAVVPLHTEYEAAPLELRRRQPCLRIGNVIPTWRSCADVLRGRSMLRGVTDPDGHMNV
eukprot:5925502-Prymnesium_polylepis.3